MLSRYGSSVPRSPNKRCGTVITDTVDRGYWQIEKIVPSFLLINQSKSTDTFVHAHFLLHLSHNLWIIIFYQAQICGNKPIWQVHYWSTLGSCDLCMSNFSGLNVVIRNIILLVNLLHMFPSVFNEPLSICKLVSYICSNFILTTIFIFILS